ncbi:TPA: hypothetical protein DD425_00540 [Candidatus Saccharibacteria bacterium]|nr:hypothetical protein [Candidatus Saccharibacteria bacterium]|tara:strand:+ start:980 stop:1477 length:498 start_codon:yes stop_codon:yes gene_type:complete
MYTVAFIDGQNLHMNTRAYGWSVDMARLRVYLREKYHVQKAYYFLGAYIEENEPLYRSLKRAGYVLNFKEHTQTLISKKKGNVDTDIVFLAMHHIAERKKFDKIVLISGDGDYYKMVMYFIKKQKFAKLLTPNKKSMSSLYKTISPQFTDFLDRPDIKRKISKKT